MASTQKGKYIFLLISGLSLLFIAYKGYEAGEEETRIQQHSPLVTMPIVDRVNGLGTIRAPNKIYVVLQEKLYSLTSSNRHFRRTAKLDSLAVHYDPVTDRVVLPESNAAGYHPILLLELLTGLFMIGYALVKLLRKA